MLIFDKIYKLSNNTKKKLEAFAFSAIAFRYPSEKCNQLDEILQKIGILPLKKGESESKKYQLLIDKFLYGSLFNNSVTVSEKPEEWICLKYKPRHPNPVMRAHIL